MQQIRGVEVRGQSKTKIAQIEKKYVDEGDLDFADTGQDWRDLVQCEEEQVRDILMSMYFFLIVKIVYLFISFQAKFKKARAKSSTKCGCNWKVRFTKKKGETEIKVTTMDLLQASYIHDHWQISKNWNFETIKNRCVQREPIAELDAEDGHDDNNDDDFNDGDDAASDALKQQSSVAQLQKQYKGSANVVVLSKNRYVFAKKLFDQVASYFSNKDIFNGFVDVVRSVLVTCSSTDVSDGMNRIKAYVTVDPRLQKPVENSTTLLPVARKKEGRGKKSTRGKMVRS